MNIRQLRGLLLFIFGTGLFVSWVCFMLAEKPGGWIVMILSLAIMILGAIMVVPDE